MTLGPVPGQKPVLTPNDTGSYICNPSESEFLNSIQWWINGNEVTNNNPEHVTTSVSVFGVLQIHDELLEYNGSTIQCSVNRDLEIIYSNQLLLLVEG